MRVRRPTGVSVFCGHREGPVCGRGPGRGVGDRRHIAGANRGLHRPAESTSVDHVSLYFTCLTVLLV